MREGTRTPEIRRLVETAASVVRVEVDRALEIAATQRISDQMEGIPMVARLIIHGSRRRAIRPSERAQCRAPQNRVPRNLV